MLLPKSKFAHAEMVGQGGKVIEGLEKAIVWESTFENVISIFPNKKSNLKIP